MSMDQLEARRQDILKELDGLAAFRRGSISEQYVEGVDRDGRKKRRGPYFLYTYKEKGKTVSRRLRDPRQVELYRRQIEDYRRFQVLTAELLRIGEQAGDRDAAADEVKKTPRSRSRSKRTPK